MADSNDFTELQSLLAARRNDLPSDDYFDGVVEQFHQRQMAQVLNRRRGFFGLLADWVESLPSIFPARVALPATAACVFLALGIFSPTGTTPDAGSAISLTMEQAPEASFVAFADELSSGGSLLLGRGQDALASAEEIPHYVMAKAPANADAVVAF